MVRERPSLLGSCYPDTMEPASSFPGQAQRCLGNRGVQLLWFLLTVRNAALSFRLTYHNSALIPTRNCVSTTNFLTIRSAPIAPCFYVIDDT